RPCSCGAPPPEGVLAASPAWHTWWGDRGRSTGCTRSMGAYTLTEVPAVIADNAQATIRIDQADVSAIRVSRLRPPTLFKTAHDWAESGRAVGSPIPGAAWLLPIASPTLPVQYVGC